MKYFMLLAAMTALMNAQSVTTAAKVAPTESAPVAKPAERALTETESLKLQLSMANITLLQKKYNIEQYSKDLQPLVAEQEKVAMEACRSVGIPDEKVKTECGINTGIDQDGKPILGADGKPAQPRVWWNRPEAKK